jgi:hypothetical protein
MRKHGPDVGEELPAIFKTLHVLHGGGGRGHDMDDFLSPEILLQLPGTGIPSLELLTKPLTPLWNIFLLRGLPSSSVPCKFFILS